MGLDMMKYIHYVPAPLRKGLSSVFLGFSVVQYLGYFEGLNVLTSEYAGRSGIILAITITWMLKLDILAASIGFIGEWKSWHWPMWIALLTTTIFESLSLAINYGPGHKPMSFLQRMLSRKNKNIQ